ncbi:MAG: hypothetical protein LBT76_03645 [Tannerella sp.]|nr:hypothetical protein [Tannerella sp.]
MNIVKQVYAAIAIAAVVSIFPGGVKAQEVEVTVGGDLVSNYIWRGLDCAGVSIQPTLGVGIGGFSLTAWGSVGFESYFPKEYDFTLGYSTGGFTVAITDYWFDKDASGNGAKYFKYKAEETAHMFEGTLGYDFGALAISWNTFFGGNDFKASDELKRAYSTYIELSAPFKLGGLDFKAEIAATPWEGLYSDQFNVVNIGITGSKTIKVTDSFSIPVFTKVIFNPHTEGTYFVFGVSL